MPKVMSCVAMGAPAQVGAAGVEDDGVVRGLQQFAVARQHQLDIVLADGPLGHFIQGLQQLHRLRGLGLGAVDLELLVPVRNAHLQGHLNGAQVRIGRATQVRKPGVVVGGEGVAQDHADNSSQATENGKNDGAACHARVAKGHQ